MTDDEAAIRDLIDTWMTASVAGETETVLSLMDDDVVFLVAGEEPFGRRGFIERQQQLAGARVGGSVKVEEVQVAGDWAWARSHLTVTVTPPGEAEVKRSGYALTVFKRLPNDRWVLYRDANLVG